MKKIVVSFLLFFILFQYVSFVFSQNNVGVRMIFQNPSYILQKENIDADTFYCDHSQGDCKVNFSLEIDEGTGWKPIGTKYLCTWDFGLETPTGEEEKCNPNTIIFLTGSAQISYKVSLKTDNSVVAERTFSLVAQNEELSQTGATLPESQEPSEDQTGTVVSSGESITEPPQVMPDIFEEETLSGTFSQTGSETASGENILSGALTTGSGSEVLFNTGVSLLSGSMMFQSPSYIIPSNEKKDLYICDRSKTDCKVNFSLLVDEGSGAKTPGTQYECLWNFGFSQTTQEEQKCNPNTLVYPIGEFEISYTITQKNSPQQSISHTFFIKNQGYLEPTVSSVASSSVSPTLSFLPIGTPEIEIQSGLDDDAKTTSQDGKINLIYRPLHSYEACEWDFSGGIFATGSQKKCNPGYVTYGTGEYTIGLRVYQKENIGNFKQAQLTFAHFPEIKKETGNDTKTTQKEVSMMSPGGGEDLKKYALLLISQISPNPIGSDTTEYVELKNTSSGEVSLSQCFLDDQKESGSKPYLFPVGMVLGPGETRRFYQGETKIHLQNSGKEEVGLYCFEALIHKYTWEASIPEGFVLSSDMEIDKIQKIKKKKGQRIYEVIFQDGQKKVYEFLYDTGYIKQLLSLDISREEKKQKIFQIAQENFYQKISKQKSGIKIYGTTFPNTKIYFSFQKQEDEFSFGDFFSQAYASQEEFFTSSDQYGSYEWYFPQPQVGNFEIHTRLALSDTFSLPIEKTSEVEIDQDYIDYVSQKRVISSQENSSVVEAVITLQTKSSKNKIITNNKIICFTRDTCSINFTGEKSLGTHLNYLWDFGNGKTFQKKNPASYAFGVGKYIVSLEVYDSMQRHRAYFLIEVQPPLPQKIANKKSENKITKNQKINIIPTVHAQEISSIPTKTHIVLTLLLIVVFALGAFILLKKHKIL